MRGLGLALLYRLYRSHSARKYRIFTDGNVVELARCEHGETENPNGLVTYDGVGQGDAEVCPEEAGGVRVGPVTYDVRT